MTAARLAGAALLLVALPAVAAEPPANDTCPVLPGEKVAPEFRAEHGGRTVLFCCAACVREFQANPGAYLKNLPQAPTPPKPAPPAESGWWEQPVLAVAGFCDRHPVPVLGAVAAYLLTATAATAHRRLTRPKATPGRAGRALARPLGVLGRWTTFLLLVATAVGVDLWRAKERAEADAAEARARVGRGGGGGPAGVPAGVPAEGYQHLEKVLHYAWPRGFHALPQGTSNTYYRGNDERNDGLFNGGNYRTATYHVSLRTADGRELSPGDAVGDGPLAVRCEIVRAANTAPQLYSADQMGKVFFARPDPALGTKRLTTVRPDWHWSADLPVGSAAAADGGDLRGLWLMFTGAADGPPSLTGAVCWHYVQYALCVRDGRLDGRSAVWMMSVYPSPKLSGADSDGHWFSDRPIPEIPDGKAATDPKLLGTDRPDGEKK